MYDDEIRDYCCWKRCRQESTLIYYGAGLCDAHFEQASSVYQHTAEYLIPRVIPQAAQLILDQHYRNLDASNGPTESEHTDQA